MISFPCDALEEKHISDVSRKDIRIGVLALRGVDKTLDAWTPTAEYLNSEINDFRFTIVPLNNDNMADAVKSRQVDFVLSNPASYASLEATQGLSRIVTLRNKRMDGSYTTFGALIFTRADRKDIKTLKDLVGKRFMAVHPNAFGGWLNCTTGLLHRACADEGFKSRPV